MSTGIYSVFSVDSGVLPIEDAATSVHVNGALLQHLIATLHQLQNRSSAEAVSIRESASPTRPQIRSAAVLCEQVFIVDPYIDPRDHLLSSYSLFDNTIELEDGSYWSVNALDMGKILSWASNDVLTLMPNSWPFTGAYTIFNPTTGDSVAVDLALGPVAFGPNTHWITGIDPWLNRVYLENGSYWDIRGLDAYEFSRWEVNDTVILGRGYGQWFGSYDSILVNVERDQYLYANRRG